MGFWDAGRPGRPGRARGILKQVRRHVRHSRAGQWRGPLLAKPDLVDGFVLAVAPAGAPEWLLGLDPAWNLAISHLPCQPRGLAWPCGFAKHGGRGSLPIGPPWAIFDAARSFLADDRAKQRTIRSVMPFVVPDR